MSEKNPVVHPFLAELSSEARARVAEIVERRTYEVGEILVREGAVDRDLYLVVDGIVEVFSTGEGGGEFDLGQLHSGDVVGQLAIIDGQPRSASVRAVVSTEVLIVPADQLAALTMAGQTPWAEVVGVLARKLGHRFRETTETAVASLERQLENERSRVEAANLIVGCLLLISLATVVTKVAAIMGAHGSVLAVLSFVVITAVSAGTIAILRTSRWPMRHFGVTSEGWKHAALSGLLWTLPAMLLAVLGKWALIEWVPQFNGLPIFEPPADWGWTRLVHFFIYCGLAVLQEFIARSGLQVLIEDLLVGRWVKRRAIIVSNLVFAVFHLFNGLFFALIVFVPGLFWGWLFVRHRSLVAVGVSHALLGAWALFFLGIGPMLIELP